jgi:Pilin accessory protein (PilO).
MKAFRRKKSAVAQATANPLAGSFLLDGKTYAIGLVWFDSDKKGRARRSEAIRQAESMGENLYSIAEKSGQIAVSSTNSGHSKKMFAAAPMLANRKEKSFIAIIEIPGGYWFCAMSNGKVVTIGGNQGDAFFTEISALEAHLSVFTIAQDEQWEAIFVPASLAQLVIGNGSLQITDLLRTGAGPLRPISEKKRDAALVITAAVLLAGFVGWKVYDHYAEQVRLEQIRQRREAAQAAEAKRKQDEAAKEAERRYPWRTSPDPAAFVHACEEAIARAFVIIDGWEANGFECQNNRLAVTYSLSRDGLPGTMVITAAQRKIPALLDASGRIASWSFSLPKIDGLAKPPVSMSAEQVNALWVALNGLGVTVNTTAVSFSLPPDANGNPRQIKGRSVSFESPLGISALDDFLTIPGMTIEKLKLNFLSMTWAVEAKIYDRP